MRLYESSIPSGNAYKVRLLLAHLGLPYALTELDILATPPETRRPDFLAKNPNGRIPLLELDDGTCLAESNAILFYLASGTRYLPTERLAQAQILQWMFFEQYSHEPYVAVLKFWTIWGGLEKCSAADLDRWKTRGQAALDVMETHLATRSYFVAERFTIADVALYAYTHTAADVGFRVDPAVRAWLDRVRDERGHAPMKPDPTRRRGPSSTVA